MFRGGSGGGGGKLGAANFVNGQTCEQKSQESRSRWV